MKAPDVLIVMTRLPRDGFNKTRLIPALGPAGATDLHNRLARNAVGRASAYAMTHPATRLQIHLEGGTPAEGRAWLGALDCHVQPDGDLGKRMSSAVDLAFSLGAQRVVIIGTDCPSLDEARLAESFLRLENSDLVFGPALDGGYYLVGLSRPCPVIFENIGWGGSEVLAQSLAAARQAGASFSLLDPLPDVDLPSDLPAAETVLADASSVSVIVPTLNEEAVITRLLDQLLAARPHQILVADGGSTDRTLALCDRSGVEILSAPPGRAAQMNHAAARATGEFLLFLHADTRPPPGFPKIVARVLRGPATAAGAFRFQIDDTLPAAPLIEALVHLRCRLRNLPYGDQGLFLRRTLFNHLGGFPDQPVMEDYAMIRRLRGIGRIHIAAEPAITSSRRWTRHGLLDTFLRHQLMLAAFHLGLAPHRIARLRH